MPIMLQKAVGASCTYRTRVYFAENASTVHVRTSKWFGTDTDKSSCRSAEVNARAKAFVVVLFYGSLYFWKMCKCTLRRCCRAQDKKRTAETAKQLPCIMVKTRYGPDVTLRRVPLPIQRSAPEATSDTLHEVPSRTYLPLHAMIYLNYVCNTCRGSRAPIMFMAIAWNVRSH